VKIASWNINGINSRLEHVVKWSLAVRPDVLCLQETKCVDAKFPVSKLQAAGYEYVEFYGEKSYNGVAILSKVPLTEVRKGFPNDTADAPTRLIEARANGVAVVCAYFPHGTKIGSDKFRFKLDWVAHLRKYFDELHDNDDLVLLCGDTNITPHEMDLWNVRYWATRMHFTREERDVFLELKRW